MSVTMPTPGPTPGVVIDVLLSHRDQATGDGVPVDRTLVPLPDPLAEEPFQPTGHDDLDAAVLALRDAIRHAHRKMAMGAAVFTPRGAAAALAAYVRGALDDVAAAWELVVAVEDAIRDGAPVLRIDPGGRHTYRWTERTSRPSDAESHGGTAPSAAMPTGQPQNDRGGHSDSSGGAAPDGEPGIVRHWFTVNGGRVQRSTP